MKLGVMQPYFFPYLGYFSLIKYTNKWIVLDEVQYIKGGWIHRNRICNPNGGWQYIIVPIHKHSHDTVIKDIEIASNYDWKRKILNQLGHYMKKAPFYEDVISLLKEIFRFETKKICEFNVFSIEKTCDYLNIPFNCEIYSKANLSVGKIHEPDEWAFEISKSLKAKEYINAPGGKDFFYRDKFVSAGIKLKFLKINEIEYDQKRSVFEPRLSIIDVMMFNSVEKIQEMLNNYEFL